MSATTGLIQRVSSLLKRAGDSGMSDAELMHEIGCPRSHLLNIAHYLRRKRRVTAMHQWRSRGELRWRWVGEEIASASHPESRAARGDRKSASTPDYQSRIVRVEIDDESGARKVICKPWTHFPVQCGPDWVPPSAGFFGVGVGRDVNTGRGWA